MFFLEYKYSNKRISPWGGMRLLHEFYIRCGLRDKIAALNLPKPGSNRGYEALDLIEGFMMSVILGAKRLSHTGSLRHDTVLTEIFGWSKGMASQSTFSRFFRKYSEEDTRRIFTTIQAWWFEQFSIDKLTLDVDSKVITRYGEQEGVAYGYSPKKIKGRGTHHPILAFAAELNMVVHARMRKGNSTDLSEFEEFFNEIISILPAERIGLWRLDAGFYGNAPLALFESTGTKYIMGAHLKRGLVNEISKQTEWYPVQDESQNGVAYTTFFWKAAGWEKARRFVIIRRDKRINPNVRGKLLFPKVEEFESYTYTALVTNLEFSGDIVWAMYKKRGDCENRINELVYDYGIESFCLSTQSATDHVFRWTMVAYNLIGLFKLEVLRKKKNVPTLFSLHFQCIALGAYISRSARKSLIHLAARDDQKQFLEKLFRRTSSLSPPFQSSIA
jgi:hypothetical protein